MIFGQTKLGLNFKNYFFLNLMCLKFDMKNVFEIFYMYRFILSDSYLVGYHWQLCQKYFSIIQSQIAKYKFGINLPK